jgi:hypothetical protein
MKRLIVLIALAGSLSCTAKDELAISGVRSLAWLEGTWISQDSNGTFIEEWKDAGAMLTGQGRIVRGTDTTQMERLSIVADTAGLVYIVDLPNREVRFLSHGQTATKAYKNLSYSESTVATFVNDTNSFPREITYRKQNSDSLYITLTGSEAGKPVEMTFKMKKQ